MAISMNKEVLGDDHTHI